MTLGEIKRDIRLRLRQHVGTEAGGDPFTLQADILSAADEVAFRTDALFDNQTASLTDGTSDYCASDYYRITGLSVKDSAGQWRPLLLFDNPGKADRYFGGRWRDTTQEADPPVCAVFNGVNSFTLVPTPSTTRAAALRIDGWRKPGQFWTYSAGAGVTLSDSDECPLPVFAHNAVFQIALANQALFDTREFIRALYPVLKKDADDEVGRVEGHVATHHSRTAYLFDPTYDHRDGM